MKKIFFVNFDVGSGIQYIGNLFFNMLKDKYDVYQYQLQNPSFIIIDEIASFQPDIIILNEVFRRSMEASYFYKRIYPKTKVIQICHDWCKILDIFDPNNKNKMDFDVLNLQKHFFNKIDKIFLLNFKKTGINWPLNFDSKRIVQGYFTVDEKYRIIRPWNERSKNICYIGTIEPLRLSTKFLEILKDYPDLKIDCYGRRISFYEEYNKLFDSLENINYYGLLEQEQVHEKLNEYKYFIIAHEDKGEVFFLILLQAILCGTIPLISFNSLSNQNLDSNWLDWANGFYFGCENEIDLLENTKKLLNEKPDLSKISSDISERAKKKFSYNRLKDLFLSMI